MSVNIASILTPTIALFTEFFIFLRAIAASKEFSKTLQHSLFIRIVHMINDI